MSEEVKIEPISLKCRICGGNLVGDYIGLSYNCENCGNKWDMSEITPEIKKYTGVTDKIRKATEMISDCEDRVVLSQAHTLFKRAEEECLKESNVITSELLRICNEGQKKAEALRHYSLGKEYYENGNYAKSIAELKQVKDMKDTQALIESGELMLKKNREKRIPLAVIVGMIIPAVMAIFLHEYFSVHIAICIPVFILASTAFGYGVYRGGAVAVIIEILSFLLLVPLLIFLLLAYVLQINKILSLVLAIGVPILIVVALVIIFERGN